MFPIRMLFSVATAGLLVLGASLAASQQQAAGGLQRPDQAETKPQADDLSQKGVVIHAEPENLQETPKSEVWVFFMSVTPSAYAYGFIYSGKSDTVPLFTGFFPLIFDPRL